MINPLRAFLVILCMILVMGIYPQQRNADSIEDNAKDQAKYAVNLFLNSTLGKGYVDVKDYDVFIKMLGSTTLIFDVTLEHYKKNIQPVYTDPNNPATFQNTSSINFDGYFTLDILNKLYPNTTAAADDPTRRYTMNQGDLFNVRIKSRGISIASRIRSFIFFTRPVPIAYNNGGVV